MTTAKKNQPERELRVVKSHDGLDVDQRVSVVGDPDPRTAALIEQGYYEWVGEAPAPAQQAGGEDAGQQ